MSTAFHAYSSKIYRHDIQGVRAIGALLIMIYHLWLNKVSGGVDVFFVVSGFFMGTQLLGQLAREGAIEPLRFWGNIIQRVAPSAYTVLAATLVLAYLFIPETQWIRLINEVLASALQLENLFLMQTAVDYLAQQEPASAVQQFWALSIQMQFYLVLPLLFWLGAALAGRARSAVPLAAVVGLVLLASFIYSLVATGQTPQSAYFNPLARLWEFLVGVSLALLLPYLRLGHWPRQLLGAVGLVALLVGGLLIPRGVYFPGYIALVPVVAAACLIVSGGGSTRTWVERLLATRVLSFLGGISFTIYLWHWPLRVAYQQASSAPSISLWAGLGIIVCSIALAYLTTRWVETPLRARRKDQPWIMPFVVGAGFAIPLVLLAGLIKVHFKLVVDGEAMAAREPFSGSGVEAQRDADEITYAQFLSVKKLLPKPYLESCQQTPASPEVLACPYGDLRSDTVVALVGGSHATQWLPAFDDIGRRKGIKVLNITKSFCPYGALEDSHPSCVEWNKRLTQYLIDTRPAVVVTNSTRTSKHRDEEHVPQSYVEQWQALGAHGIEVVGIRDNPQYPFDPVDCLARNKKNALACTRARTDALAPRDPALALLDEVDNLKLVDMSNYFCTDKICPTLSNNLLMYSDPEHISVAYVTFLQGKLAEQLKQAVPHVFDAANRATARAR